MQNDTMKRKLMDALLSVNSTKLNGLAFVAMMSKGKDHDAVVSSHAVVSPSSASHETDSGM